MGKTLFCEKFIVAFIINRKTKNLLDFIYHFAIYRLNREALKKAV